jgi:hypothetical protein
VKEEDLETEIEAIILIQILNRIHGREIDSTGSGQGQVVGRSEYGNEPSASVKCRKNCIIEEHRRLKKSSSRYKQMSLDTSSISFTQ